jgi:uncharacterized protein (TIGR02117 family)
LLRSAAIKINNITSEFMSKTAPQAAQANAKPRWFKRWGVGCLGLSGVLLCYPLTSALCLLFPRNTDVANHLADRGEVLIYVIDNGVHSDLMLPASHALHDWRSDFSLSNFPPLTPLQPDWVLIGWGDAEFYLHTPSWSDLSLGTALRALSGRNPAVLHVAFHHDADFAGVEKWPLRVSHAQYQALIDYIQRSSPATPANALPGFHYGANDAFFSAAGHYSLFTTCNTWTGDALASAGVRVSPWTPFVWNLRWSLPRLDAAAQYD